MNKGEKKALRLANEPSTSIVILLENQKHLDVYANV